MLTSKCPLRFRSPKGLGQSHRHPKGDPKRGTRQKEFRQHLGYCMVGSPFSDPPLGDGDNLPGANFQKTDHRISYDVIVYAVCIYIYIYICSYIIYIYICIYIYNTLYVYMKNDRSAEPRGWGRR